MSQNQNDDQPLDTTAAENGPADDATQVIDASGRNHQHTQDDPLSAFDQGEATSAYDTSAYGTAAYETTSSGTASYDTSSYDTSSYGSASSDAGAAQPAYEPQYAVPPTSSYGAAPATGWSAPPQPLVRTTPRTSTIVWGFIILAIGVGAISVAAGATLDVGLAMIWLLAAAGAVLIVASVVGAARRRNRAEGPAQV